MRHIEVDIDVFAAIWAQRLPREANENEILKRLLAVSTLTKTGSEREHADLEEKSSKTSEVLIMRTSDEVGKVRWVDDVRLALRALGGQAPLAAIYEAVELQRRNAGRSLPKTLDAIIRRTLEDHSSDSANFKGTDLFALPSRGVWALKQVG